MTSFNLNYFLIYCIFKYSHIGYIYIYIYSSKLLSCNFLIFGTVIFWFCFQGDRGFIELLLKCSFLFSLLEEFETNRYKYFCMFYRNPQLRYTVLDFCFQEGGCYCFKIPILFHFL